MMTRTEMKKQNKKCNKIEQQKIAKNAKNAKESNKIQTFDTLNIQEVLNIKIDIINKKNINTFYEYFETINNYFFYFFCTRVNYFRSRFIFFLKLFCFSFFSFFLF